MDTVSNSTDGRKSTFAEDAPRERESSSPPPPPPPPTGHDLILQAALHAVASGLSVIPVKGDGNKGPRLHSWREYQQKAASAEQVRQWHADQPLDGFGVMGGYGGIAHVDFDVIDAYRAFVVQAEKWGLGPLLDRIRTGFHDRTPNGCHLTYRCAQPPPTGPLAKGPDGKSTIEMRGVGAYAIAAPTTRRVHPSGEPYTRVSGDFDQIVTITPEEQVAFLSCARSLDESPTEKPKDEGTSKSAGGGVKPGDAFAEATDWADILEPHGWTIFAHERDDLIYWTRPGKDTGVSASTGYGEYDLFKVFTTSIPEFPAGSTSSKFHVYAVLNHGGDHKKAAAALRAQGFGDKHDKDTLLAEMNEKHAMVVRNGRTVVANFGYHPVLKRDTITYSSFDDIINRYSNVFFVTKQTADDGNVKVGKSELGKAWLKWSERRSYDDIMFAPGQELEDKYLNLWKGFAVEPKQGSWQKFRTLIRDVICNGKEEYETYLLNWMARTVQFPGLPGEVAVSVCGKRGAGKGKFCTTFGSLFGRHFFPTASSGLLTKEFNLVVETTAVLFLDEAFWAGDKAAESKLKEYITEKTVAIRAMRTDYYLAPNCLHILMATNEDWCVPAGAQERRFFVLDVSDRHLQDTTYFAAIDEEMDNGGREAMLYDLLHWDISKFNVRDVPQTKALERQKMFTMAPAEKWWYEKLWDGELVEHAGIWPAEINRKALHEDYCKRLKLSSLAHSTTITLGLFLHKVVPEVRDRKTRWLLPPLAECRAAWDRLMRTTTSWPDEDESGQELEMEVAA